MPISEIVHVAKIHPAKKKPAYLFLKEDEAGFYWDGADFRAKTLQEAIALGEKNWKLDHFKLLGCGFLYTLPERDEHGMNATFAQMAKSQATPTGRYFEKSLGHLCFVQGASQEAISLLRSL